MTFLEGNIGHRSVAKQRSFEPLDEPDDHEHETSALSEPQTSRGTSSESHLHHKLVDVTVQQFTTSASSLQGHTHVHQPSLTRDHPDYNQDPPPLSKHSVV